jgi:hypothetical protein
VLLVSATTSNLQISAVSAVDVQIFCDGRHSCKNFPRQRSTVILVIRKKLMPTKSHRDALFSRLLLAIALVVALCSSLSAQKHGQNVPMPTQFEIGRHTFFDFGPPNDYYELLFVRPAEQGTSVERLTLTPHGMGCVTAKFEAAQATLTDSVTTLLGNTNPCKIPEKDLRRELKRCKHCLTFSGINVVMWVPCGDQTRMIRAAILDRDLFSADPKTPEHTSWTMSLLNTLDRALPPGVMNKPALGLSENSASSPIATTVSSSAVLRDLADGKYDALFAGPDKPSELYRQAQEAPRPPSVDLVSITPFSPDVFVKPAYPLAGLTAQEGLVSFTIHLDENGNPVQTRTLIPNPDRLEADIKLDSGPPFFFHAVSRAVAKWHFPQNAAGQEVHVEIRFTSGCPKKTN